MGGWVSWCPGYARRSAGDCRLAVLKENLSRKLAQQRAITWSLARPSIRSAGRPCSFFAVFFSFSVFLSNKVVAVHFSPGAASRAHSVEVSRHNSEVYNKSIREVVLHSGVRVKGNRGIYNSLFITL